MRDPSSRKAGGLPNRRLKTPKEWPSDTKIDPGRWVFWLPEGWKQAKRTQEESGKVLTCYFNEENKRFWHKRDIEKFLGYELEERPAKEEKAEDDDTTTKKYVTDDDVFPRWPGDWLPRDWRLGFRELPSGLHRIHVPPNQEEGFCYHRAGVLEYIQTGRKLSSFGTSLPAEEKWGHVEIKKRKHKRDGWPGRQYKFAKADDYLEVKTFRVLKLPLSEEEENNLWMETLADFQEIQEQLRERGFEDPTFLLTTLTNSKQSKEPVPGQKIVERMCSLWYCRPDDFCEKQCYQRVFLKEEQIGSKKDLICSDTHIFWSPQYNCWKIGRLNEDMAGYLRCDDPAQFPWETKKDWKVVEAHLCVP